MKSSASNPKQSGSKAALNRSAVSLIDASEAAKISAHAASHAKPKCKWNDLMIFAPSLLVRRLIYKKPDYDNMQSFRYRGFWGTRPDL